MREDFIETDLSQKFAQDVLLYITTKGRQCPNKQHSP